MNDGIVGTSKSDIEKQIIEIYGDKNENNN